MKHNKQRRKSAREKQAQRRRRWGTALIALLCAVLFVAGYIGAEAHIIRHARAPQTDSVQKADTQQTGAAVTETGLSFAAIDVPSIALDNSVMLSAAVNGAQKQGFSGITFDLKRQDGTIGYTSRLTVVETFGAVSSPATKLHDSMKALTDKNIVPIGRICCYKDNVVPAKSGEMALMNGDTLYRDDKGNTYLNPDSASAYKYLRELIEECYALGVKNFVLSATTLPEGAPKVQNSGFEALSAKLKRDIDGDVNFMEEVNVAITGWSDEYGEYNQSGIQDDVKNLPAIKSYQMYAINTNAAESGMDTEELNAALKESGVRRYMIIE